MGVRTSIRTDTPTPVVIVNSEFESTHLKQVPCVDTDWLRAWEVAGTLPTATPARLDEVDRRGRAANRLRYALRAGRRAPRPTLAGRRHRRRTNPASRWIPDLRCASPPTTPTTRAAASDSPRWRHPRRRTPRRGHGDRPAPAVRRGDPVHRRRAALSATRAGPTTSRRWNEAVDALVAPGA